MDEFWRGRLSPDACAASGAADARTHLAIATEALGGLAAALGLGAPFAASALARLSLHSAEIEITGAAKAGDAVRLTGGVAGWTEDALTAVFTHSDADGGALARTRIRARHVSARSFEAFAWPRRATEAFGRLPAQDTGWQALTESDAPGLEQAQELAAAGRGVFGAADADTAGRVTAHAILGRLLDAAGEADEAGARTNLVLHIAALPGRPYAVFAKDGGAWMLDAASGRALAELAR